MYNTNRSLKIVNKNVQNIFFYSIIDNRKMLPLRKLALTLLDIIKSRAFQFLVSYF
uniref:Uncharacterized protein n=1 Tax=Porphyridium purpureum TaxID=35688 RepID=W0RYF4_PORPP|nr:hypothetical protein Y721_p199 [Porphyridium purpureum]ATJ02840.1 hypothetical protein [Porphyridium purpureum]BAO23609.1 hypothetical protein [Porphyridium purpureum]